MHHGDPDQIAPRRTHQSNICWRLEGGTEDNDLWATNHRDDDGGLIVESVFVPTDEQRKRIADGENIALFVWGQQPPVAVRLTAVAIGKAPESDPDCIECERHGGPTEGMTLSCTSCFATVCLGHVTAHEKRMGHAVVADGDEGS